MLAREHEADLEREAQKRALATHVAKGVLKWPLAVVARDRSNARRGSKGGDMKPNRRRALALATAALLAISAGFEVGPAAAAADVNIVTHQAVPIGAGTGTFNMTGDLTDAGAFQFTSFLFTSGQGSPVTTEHVSETWTGLAGTLTVEKQCRSVFIGFGATDDCEALVTGGTGAYSGLHGAGTCTGIINFVTGIASQTCEFSLKE